jgi:hypothetical protein
LLIYQALLVFEKKKLAKPPIVQNANRTSVSKFADQLMFIQKKLPLKCQEPEKTICYTE